MILFLFMLIMLWLISCALCAGIGFFIGQRCKRLKPVAAAVPTPEEKRRAEQEMLELQNFFDYDGSEQKPVNTP